MSAISAPRGRAYEQQPLPADSPAWARIRGTAPPYVVAADRPETDPCERNTPGCCVAHTDDQEGECQTW